MNSARMTALVVVVLSCLALTTTATATNSVDFSNSGGTLSGTNSGLSLTGSTLIAITGSGGMTTGDLGTLSFTTGALTSGSLAMGGTLAAGGMFEIDGNGTNGVANGVLFSGSFSGPSTWALTTLADGTHNYTLTGIVTGTMNGASVEAVTVQLTINTGKGFFDGSTLIAGGDTTTVSSVPEPSSLALFGTGAMGLLGMMRRKLFAR
jgi:hypothetical protein